ncbi:MAG: hypothetical protein QG618_1787, partial [Thermodesulfobacteriota bacterium]|nr:hypothetical protein [Thermodesulfobacteriota bacterium]
KLRYLRASQWNALRYFNAPARAWKDETVIYPFIITVYIDLVSESWRP